MTSAELIRQRLDASRRFRRAEAERLREQIANETYTGEYGELRWKSNLAAVPMHCFEDAAIEAPASQRAVIDADTARFINDYRLRDTGLTEEQIAEMRAELGTGTEVVNVLTGRRTKL